MSSLYDVLGVPVCATGVEIKTAYRRLARTCHPDVVRMVHENKSATTHEFLKIHAAYSTLSDPNKRATYDRDLFRQRGGGLSSRMQYSSYGVGSNWESDQCW